MEIPGCQSPLSFAPFRQVEEQPATSSNPARAGKAQEEPAAAEDRLELVRAQNLASPVPEPVVLDKAIELLRQVREQLHLLEKKEAQELYQEERLKELSYRIFQVKNT